MTIARRRAHPPKNSLLGKLAVTYKKFREQFSMLKCRFLAINRLRRRDIFNNVRLLVLILMWLHLPAMLQNMAAESK